ncbi:MAG: hypothetical protein HMLKMBBP_00156 [Planctomycetes bacterium]|nr:hypothetical protein [Planctomycetota bacterium]
MTHDDSHPRPPDATDASATDRVRALCEGRLSSADADRVRAEIAADPELRAFAEAFDAVHASTGGDAFPAAPAAFRAPRGTVRRFPRWIAAAALLVAAGGAWAFLGSSRGPSDVVAPVLASLGAGGDVPAAAQADAHLLASAETVRDGKLVWMTDMRRAEALSSASGKPMLVFLQHPTCPWCKELKEGPWSDAGVIAAASEFVPVMLSVLDEVPERFHGVFPDKWPYVGVIAPDGTTVAEFPGVRPTESMKTEIDSAVHVVETRSGRAPSWSEVRGAATALLAGRTAEAAGRLGEAWLRYDESARFAASPTRGDASHARSVLQGRLRDALSSAAKTAETDAPSAAAGLRAEADRFAGSPPEPELRAVADALERRGAFPVLLEKPRR